MLRRFWGWYKENIAVNQAIVAVLFAWQLLHLYWLTTNVLSYKILGYELFNPGELYEFLLVLLDYTEIPALISGTLLYFHFSKEKFTKKNILFLILINSQWLHLFWITDEFVVERIKENSENILPVWLAWLAIFIDYLELPVIFDTLKNALKSLRSRLN